MSNSQVRFLHYFVEILRIIHIKLIIFLAKKMKDTLSSFLPQLPGVIDTPGNQDNSSLRGLIEKPPGTF